jgi:hypothetical protein
MKVYIYSDSGVTAIDGRTLEDAMSECVQLARKKTTEAIESSGIDEKTQLNAIAGIYSPERCEAIKSYIAACRNEYLRCKALILTAQTNDEADAVQFLAPPVPEGM